MGGMTPARILGPVSPNLSPHCAERGSRAESRKQWTQQTRPSLSFLMASFHARRCDGFVIGGQVANNQSDGPQGRKSKKSKSKAPAFQYTLNSHKQRAYVRRAARRRNARMHRCADHDAEENRIRPFARSPVCALATDRGHSLPFPVRGTNCRNTPSCCTAARQGSAGVATTCPRLLDTTGLQIQSRSVQVRRQGT